MTPKKSSFKWPAELRVICWKDNLNWKDSEEVAHSWGDLLSADTGTKLHTAIEFDSVDRYRWLGRMKLFDLTTAAAVETKRMLGAEGRFCIRDGGPFPVRIAWVNSRGNSGFIVRQDSNIWTPHDIKPGTRINRLVFYGSQKVVDGLLAWGNASPGDIVWVDVHSWDESCDAVIEGRSDVAFCYPNTPSACRAEEKAGKLNWLDLDARTDPEGAQRFRKVDPIFTFAPMHTGVASAIGHWGVTGINFEQTRADVDPQLVYNLAKWFDENYERFKDKHPFNRFRNRETLLEGLKNTFLPCHEGLITYLKEIGVWTKAHDVRQKENERLVDAYADGYLECMRQADVRKIWVARENDEWINLWNDYKKAKFKELVPFDGLPIGK